MNSSYAEFNSTRFYPTTAEALEMFKADPLLHEPGEKYTYTTFGYTLLGCVLESAGGMKFGDYVRDNIFKPAGMDRMRVDSVSDIIPNRAQGYRKTEAGALINSPLADNSCKIPGGGLVSTVEDLARFAIAVQSNMLLKKEMTRADVHAAEDEGRQGDDLRIGLGCRRAERRALRRTQRRAAAHQRPSFACSPSRGVAVAVMVNLEGAPTRRPCQQDRRPLTQLGGFRIIHSHKH